MDLTVARFNMVHQQVRPWDVSNPRILELLSTIPRERFVPQAFQHLAFSDSEIPIGYNQIMLAPKIVGRLLQALDLNPEASVLEIGTGTGYVTALLSNLVKKLISVEIVPQLSEQASKILSSLGIHNVQLEIGDAVKGWSLAGPYDAIIYTGSLPSLPYELRDQITPNGQLIITLGEAPSMSTQLLVRSAKGTWIKKSLFETVMPPLINTVQPEGFRF